VAACVRASDSSSSFDFTFSSPISPRAMRTAARVRSRSRSAVSAVSEMYRPPQ
jgi:hypothetical protein